MLLQSASELTKPLAMALGSHNRLSNACLTLTLRRRLLISPSPQLVNQIHFCPFCGNADLAKEPLHVQTCAELRTGARCTRRHDQLGQQWALCVEQAQASKQDGLEVSLEDRVDSSIEAGGRRNRSDVMLRGDNEVRLIDVVFCSTTEAFQDCSKLMKGKDKANHALDKATAMKKAKYDEALKNFPKARAAPYPTSHGG